MDLISGLSAVLQPYKEWVGLFTMVVTGLQMLSPSVFLWGIKKKGTTRGISFLPMLMGLIPSLLFLRFGYLIGDLVTLKVHSLGLILGTLYLAVFIYYTPYDERPNIFRQIFYGLVFASICISYTFVEHPDNVVTRFGAFLTIVMYFFILSPLLELKTVIKNQSTESLPFPMIFMGSFVGLSWLLYGIILNNGFMIAQTSVACIICLGQLSLFVIYPSTSKSKEKEKKKD